MKSTTAYPPRRRRSARPLIVPCPGSSERLVPVGAAPSMKSDREPGGEVGVSHSRAARRSSSMNSASVSGGELGDIGSRTSHSTKSRIASSSLCGGRSSRSSRRKPSATRDGCISSSSLRQGSPGIGTLSVRHCAYESTTNSDSAAGGLACAARSTSTAWAASQSLRLAHWGLSTHTGVPDGSHAIPGVMRSRGPLSPSGSTITCKPCTVP